MDVHIHIFYFLRENTHDMFTITTKVCQILNTLSGCFMLLYIQVNYNYIFYLDREDGKNNITKQKIKQNTFS